MNIAQGAKTFTDMFPDMMKATKLLIIDHDVTRYHSLDLLRYTLFKREDLFWSLKQEYQKLITPHLELAEHVQFMRTHVQEFNIFNLFDQDAGVHTTDEYTAKIREMLADKQAKITPTDVSTRFDVVFDKPNITGYLLRYKGETNIPSCYGKLTVYEDPNILTLDTAEKIVWKHGINAIMVASSEMAVRLAAMLVSSGYESSITFMVAQYLYNFTTDESQSFVPTYNREMGFFELKCKHEFGFFDPFSGLTYRYRLLNNEE